MFGYIKEHAHGSLSPHQYPTELTMPSVKTPLLEVHYTEHGPPDGWPVVLSHGFPYSPHVYDKVTPHLTQAGARVIIPYLRGYGPTRFLSSATIRTAQQAALASDLIALLDALNIEKAILAGFDWGGLASCASTALWPERVAGLVCYAGYDVYEVATGQRPCAPQLEKIMWYQHLFQSGRGKECLKLHRREIARMLWQEWSPNWTFDEELFDLAAKSFENEDFVDIAISPYRHAFGNFRGDPRYDELERRLAAKPKIVVPAVTVDGVEDPLKPGGTQELSRAMFEGRHGHWKLQIGHAFPIEAPEEFAKAVLTVREWTQSEQTEPK